MAFQSSIVSNEAALSLKDPVCGMTVTPQSPHMLQHEGKPIYFCSAGCKGKFAANPAKYPFANFGAATPAPAVFTHSADYYPSPVLYPITERGFDGLAWNTPWFMLVNYAALCLTGLWLWFSRKSKHAR